MGKKGFAGNKERKRGRKKSKIAVEAQDEDAIEPQNVTVTPPAAASDQPAWIARQGDEEDPTAPFGFVDTDVKTYFKDLFSQLKASESTVVYGEDDAEAAEFSEHALLVQAALREADGRVLTLATDPDMSVVLEYLIGHLKGKAIRILLDRMSGSLFVLARHRFGSHVLQSTLTALQPLVSDEVKTGSGDTATAQELGHLRSPVKLLTDAIDELHSHLAALVQDSFGTHILRVLLFILAGRPVSDGQASKSGPQPLSARSKRSSKYRSKEITSIARSQDETEEPPQVPSSFEPLLERVRTLVLSDMGSNEVHAIAVSPVAAPVLSIFLEFEARSPNPSTRPEAPNSLHDLLLDGLASYVHGNPSLPAEGGIPERTDFTESMLRDTVGSLTLQAALSTASPHVIFLFYKIYFSGRLIKLAVHPVANFVAATLVRRLGWIVAQAREHLVGVTPDEGHEAGTLLNSALEEVKAAGNKVIKERKTSVFSALLEAASVADSDDAMTMQAATVEALCASFWLSVPVQPPESMSAAEEEQEHDFLPVILSLQTRKDWIKTQAKKSKVSTKTRGGRKDAFSQAADEDDESDTSDEEDNGTSHPPEVPAATADEVPTDTQGSLLLQILAKLNYPANDVLHRRYVFGPILPTFTDVSFSLQRQSPETLLGLCKSSTAVHIVLAMLSSSTTTFQQKKKLYELLLPQLCALADDRWGSRVGDALWDSADVFVRSKMVRHAQAQERGLLASQFGRFLLKRLNPGMFRKSQERWREWAKQFAFTPAPSLRDETLQALRTAAEGVPGFTKPKASKPSKRKREHDVGPSQDNKSKKDSRSKNKKPKNKSKRDGLDAELDAIFAEAE